MKIQQKVDSRRFTFASLACGDTFRAVESDPGVLWMKTCRIEVDEGEVYNAVNLSNGDIDTFGNDEEVVPVTVTAVEEVKQ